MDECGGCGEDLYDGIGHECPVLGCTVTVELFPGPAVKEWRYTKSGEGS